jgi:UDP-N-acetylmuramoyl-tripeptide--D-alanyl-D-alanine ligase
MSTLWTSAELRAATGGTLAADVAVSGLSIDTRTIQPGDLFIALRDARDGHDFVAEALAKGAACALVDRDPPGLASDAPLLRVGDTLDGLAALGTTARARSNARVVGVTGSVGKTTTKEMLLLALAALGSTHGSAASYNNHWGVPITLARQPREARFVAIEIGMNKRGEIAPLARMARPHVAIITTIGTSHIGNLGSQQAIAEEKADILLGLEKGGVAILPAESPFLPLLLARATQVGARVLTFGESTRSDIQLTDYVAAADRSTARLLMDGLPLSVHLSAPGHHLALNACAVLAAVHALEGDVVAAAEALGAFAAPAGRGQRVKLALAGGEALLIDDSYNASPASIRAGLAVLASQPVARRIVALGDMRELGENAAAMHAELAYDVAAAADLVYCCGPLMQHLFDALPATKQGSHLPDSAALAAVLADVVRPGDAVLVKGSLGSRMAAVVAALKSLNNKTGAAGAGVVS